MWEGREMEGVEEDSHGLALGVWVGSRVGGQGMWP